MRKTIVQRLSSLRSSKPSAKRDETAPQQQLPPPPPLDETSHEVDDSWEHTDLVVRALYDFNAEVETDLSLTAGQILYVTMEDKLWYLGSLSKCGEGASANPQGVFPKNFVEVLPRDFTLPDSNASLDSRPAASTASTAAYDPN